MMWGLIGVVFRKEVIDNLRDRRTLAAALMYPFLGPAMILLVVFAIGQITQRSEEPLKLPVEGRENAPNLVMFLEQHNVIVEPAPDDAEQAVSSGEHDIVLIIPEAFGESFREGRPAPIRLVLDDSRNSAMTAIQRAMALLQTYSAQTGRLRLQARGVDPRIVDTLALERVDVSTPQSQAARFLNMAPYLIIVSLFVGGMYLAIDSTAGERERGSLEPLLINPLSRLELVAGKTVAVLLFTLVAALETIIGFAVVLNYVPLERYIGVQMSLSPLSLLSILGITLPLMVFAVALQMMIASYTKSFKEAQNYISLLLLVPALPAMIMAILPVKDSFWLVVIPTVGQQLFINQILRGESVDPTKLTVSALITLGAGLTILGFVVRQYRREGILFR